MGDGVAARSEAIQLAYDRLRASEDVIAKALRVSELAKMAKIEQRAREHLDKQWEIRRKQASLRAKSLTASGKSAKQIVAGVRAVMETWPGAVEDRFNKDQAEVYKLARLIGHKKATKQTKANLAFNTPNFTEQEMATMKAKRPRAVAAPSFTLADEQAIAALAEQNVFWIGAHYDENIARSIGEVTTSTLAAGEARRVAAITMAERVATTLGRVITPGGFAGTSLQYFEGLTANAMTVARAFGQMRSFDDIGITRYQIVNPQDSRTCKVCGHMDGKVFTVEQGRGQMEAELEADSPDDIRRIHPWMNLGQLRKVSSRAGQLSGRAGTKDSAALASAGLALPPFHFRCRCTVDIDAAVGSYSALR